MNNGYINYSRSVRSQNAIDDYEMPLSRINKELLEVFLEEFAEEEELDEADIIFLKNVSVAKWKWVAKTHTFPSSWHHTSKYFNETNHYDLYKVAEDLIDLKDRLDKDYKEYRKRNKPSEEELRRREERRQERKRLKEKEKYFKYQNKCKTLGGFLRSENVDLEALEVIRQRAIEIKQYKLRLAYCQQSGGDCPYIDDIDSVEAGIKDDDVREASKSDKEKYFKYQKKYKTIAGFLKSKKVDMEKLEKIRKIAIAIRRSKLRATWEKQYKNDENNWRWKYIDDDRYIENRLKANDIIEARNKFESIS